jgi:hypothetical protein
VGRIKDWSFISFPDSALRPLPLLGPKSFV